MKLLSMFPSPIRGGAEEYALRIASAAMQAGWEVHAAFPQTPKTNALIGDFQARGITYHPLDIAPVTGRRRKLFREGILQFLRTFVLLRKIKPDTVHLTLPWASKGFNSLLACGFLHIPTVVVFQLVPYSLSFTQSQLKAYTWARSRHQAWVAISENNRQFVCESFQISQDRVKLIYNGTKVKSEFINCNSWEFTQLRSQVRQELGLPESTKLLLTVARLDNAKGYGELVQVVAPITKEFPDVRFVWVGEGELKKYLVKKVKEYEVEDKVLMLGYRSDVPRLMKAADLFVFPTHFEGLPFAMIEAIAYGLPVVASDVSSIPEIIKDREQGLLFPSKNPQALWETLRYALQYPEVMQDMAKKAKPRVQDFSEERMVRETLDLLTKLGNSVSVKTSVI